jgi:hypothetical protein
VRAVVALVRALAVGRLADRDPARDPTTETLAALLDRVVVDGEAARIEEKDVLDVLGLPSEGVTVGAAWRRLLEAEPPESGDGRWVEPLETILERGPLARRMLAAAGDEPDPVALGRMAAALCDCLQANASFGGLG